MAVIIGIAVALGSGLILITLVGTLFLGISVGQQWSHTAFTAVYETSRDLSTNPLVLATVLGVGYYAHVTERERAYKRHVERQHRQGDPTETITHERPRWQLVAGFTGIGCIGALDWLVIHTGHFPRGSGLGAFVIWMTGATGIAYFLRRALHEDRDVAGFDVWSPPWVFTTRYALSVGLIGSVHSLIAPTAPIPEPHLSLLLWIPPITGGLYVFQRILKRRTRWQLPTTNWLRARFDSLSADGRIDSETEPDDKNKNQ
ncbi:hypothetical protein [Haladaptatus sp. DFWS20]|uniref:hypothetical protein n=1 Tax=Haladaptatus sp. DFWS20 TaxID=3403467 RepID=UPI003EB9F44D